MKKSILVLLMATALVGCTRSAHLTVVNNSAAPLTGVVVTGTGYGLTAASLAPGKQERVAVTVRPSKTTALTLDFEAGGKHQTTTVPESTWSDFKEIIFTVTADFSIQQSAVTRF